MGSEWQHGLFGCFDNFGICIISYFVPCYTFGKNSEAVGDSCLLCGLAYLVPLLNIFAALQVRGKIRDQKGISGGCLSDFLYIICCPCCALIQEAQEIQGPGGMSMARQ
ncbi:cell number regulator 3-like [Gigantopelta aegis]|uniref:cell number regulator 3-like n=1 Tax=Gigantopelta aegis TaxID=1735272 RepID=UPI001B88984C|nr:cell number regulator 3-like [Gigantopelta aegis]